ncbi:DUF397 domain-containing protein [Streptomyces sp. NPDC001978]|uniref:DUF397 domain-containing protein n=1 Tax=Streptomyces sp. NPDC001978 TaxID=3364627 RepID=UPI00367E946C
MIHETSVGGVSDLNWFKSSYSSNGDVDDCVEIATTPTTIHIRDSKNTAGPRLGFTPAVWTDFVGSVGRS